MLENHNPITYKNNARAISAENLYLDKRTHFLFSLFSSNFDLYIHNKPNMK